MSKNVATLDENNIVIAINVKDDDYDLQPNQVLVTTFAYVGGDYVDGYFYNIQPFPSWTRDKGEWIPPIPSPAPIGWYWDESILTWIEQ